MVLKPHPTGNKIPGEFENDVKMYGTQTARSLACFLLQFENDVKMYGTQTSRSI